MGVGKNPCICSKLDRGAGHWEISTCGWKSVLWDCALKIVVAGQVLVAHVCSPSYSGGGDQEDFSLKLGQIVQETLSREKKYQKTITKKVRWSGSRGRP
jgi:hypothetical protein